MRARIDELLGNRWLMLALRVALGGIFIAAGVPKLQLQTVFIDTVAGYGILPDTLAQFYGLTVPWVELFIGCCLILGIFSRFATIVSILLIVSFAVASTYRLVNPVGDSCGCFGELFTLSHPASLSLDTAMLCMALLLLFSEAKEEFLSIGPWLSRHNPVSGRRGRFISVNASKLAVVAVAMVIVVPFLGTAQSPPDTGTNGEPVEMSYWRGIDSALEQGKPVFLYFYTVGCSSCEEQKPVINELMRGYGDRIVFMDVLFGDSNVAMEFNVQGVPTVLLITGKDSEGKYTVYQRFEGVTGIETLRNGIEQVLRLRE